MKEITIRFNSNYEMTKNRFSEIDVISIEQELLSEIFSSARSAAEKKNDRKIAAVEEKYSCKIKIEYEDSFSYWNGGPAIEIFAEDEEIPEDVRRLRAKIENDFSKEVEAEIIKLFVQAIDDIIEYIDLVEYVEEEELEEDKYESFKSYAEKVCEKVCETFEDERLRDKVGYIKNYFGC